LAKLFSSQLYGVKIFDPITLLAALGLTAVTVLVATALPARRAAGVQPMKALRTE
jgi:ABC-type lipoprotein release transport system permease subunit